MILLLANSNSYGLLEGLYFLISINSLDNDDDTMIMLIVFINIFLECGF